MASLLSGQDEPNHVVIGYSSRQNGLSGLCTGWKNLFLIPYNKSFIDQACSVKVIWLDIGLVLEFTGLNSISVHKHATKELGQHPAILTSHLPNNQMYILSKVIQTELLFGTCSWGTCSSVFFWKSSKLVKTLLQSSQEFNYPVMFLINSSSETLENKVAGVDPGFFFRGVHL